MAVSFPLKTKTRNGHDALVFAYVHDQPRPWLGAYLIGDEVDGYEYIPVSWIGSGLFSADKTTDGKPITRGLDIPELKEQEEVLKFEKAKRDEAKKNSSEGMD